MRSAGAKRFVVRFRPTERRGQTPGTEGETPMRIANRDMGMMPRTGLVCAALWTLAATAGLAQLTGVARPDSAPITVDADDAAPAKAAAPAKPSAAIPA